MTGGAADTKGSWVTLDTTIFPCCWVQLYDTGDVGASNTDTSTLFDLGIGGTGDAVDAILVANVPLGGAADLALDLPLHIPSGIRIAGRIQGAVASETWAPRISTWEAARPPLWEGFAFGDAIGIDTAVSGPSTGDLTDNAWDEAIASTARAYRGLSFFPCTVPGDTTMAGGAIRMQFGMGGAGAEVVLGETRAFTTSGELVHHGPPAGFVAVNVPAGSRLAIRKNTTNDCSGALVGWV
jgi:hypothetical protein